LNITVHNAAEPSAESGSKRKSHDISNVTLIFEKYVGVKVKVTNANRIGRRKDYQVRPRLTRYLLNQCMIRQCSYVIVQNFVPETIQKIFRRCTLHQT